MAPFESFGTVSYSYFIATMALSLAICEIFSVKNGDLENWVRGLLNVIENGAVQ